MTVPPGSGGLTDTTVVTAALQGYPAVYDLVTDTTSVAIAIRVELEPDRTGSAAPGEWITYTHTLTNTGDGLDVFDLTLSSSRGWPTNLLTPTTPITLTSGQTATVVISLTVPGDAISGTVDTTLITATSQTSPTVSAGVVDTTTISPSFGVELEPDRAGSTDPDTVVSYTHTLTNGCNFTATFILDGSSSHAWDVALLPPGPLTLPAGQTATVVVSLTVPPGSDSQTDITVVTATLQGSPAVWDNVVDTSPASASNWSRTRPASRIPVRSSPTPTPSPTAATVRTPSTSRWAAATAGRRACSRRRLRSR
jgi:hypothetical protein